MADTTDLEYEQTRVDAAYALAEERIETLREKLTRGIVAGDNKAADTVAGSYRTRLEQLERLTAPGQPLMLFGRVDLGHDDGRLGDVAGETFYVGRAMLSDDVDDDPTVIAWESRLAGAFRDPVNYLDGGCVQRRRQFTGENRRLTEISDTIFENGQPAPGSADPLLESLAGRTSGVLHEVVSTIQAEQFRLMEIDADKTVIVQGGPGTGKSVIGLHRVSVLLYRAEGRLTEGDVLVVGPSEVFIRYIENVLPELGRAAVRHLPIGKVGAGGVSASGRDHATAHEVKGRAVMAEVIANYLAQRITLPENELRIGARARVSPEEVRVILETARARDRGTPYMDRRARVRDGLFRLVASKDTTISRTDPALENALNRVMPDRSERRVVQDLLTGPQLLAEAADGHLADSEQTAILRGSEALARTDWTVNDVALLDEAAAQLQSGAVGQRYLHIVVDEAQDLSPMQLRVLNRRLAAGGGMTILGDLAQATSPWAASSWEEHLSRGHVEIDEKHELIQGYRIPEPLLRAANRLLDVLDVETAATRSVITEGDEPAVIHVDESDEVIAQATDVIDSLIDIGAEPGQIGVIAEDEMLARLSSALGDAGIDHTWAARSLRQPVTLVPSEDAKGLEFDHVVILEPSDLYRSHPVIGPRRLYVAMTRARQTLTLVHYRSLPRILESSASPSTGGPSTPPSDGAPAPGPVDHVAAPTRDGAREVDPWQWFVPLDGGLYEVRLDTSGGAAIVRVPAGGGAPTIVATGAAVSGRGQVAWALATSQGRAVALVTAAEPGPAAAQVVDAVIE